MMTWTVPASDATQPDYIVTRQPNGRVTCTCKGFTYRRSCRHADEARAVTGPASAQPFLAAALDYAALGYHVIPVEPGGKRPLVAWKAYQDEAPTVAQLRAWWAATPDANIGLVLGRGRFVIDLDGGPDAEALLTAAGITLPPDAPRSHTSSGFHVFLSAPTPQPDRIGLLRAEADREDADALTPKGNTRKAQVDVRGLGIIIAAPSIHPSGAVYRWVTPLTATLPMASAALLELIVYTPGKLAKKPRAKKVTV